MRLTDWFRRRILAGGLPGEKDWPITEVSEDGRRVRIKFDSIKVVVDKKRVTVYLMLDGRELTEYKHDKWIDFDGDETLVLTMLDVKPTMGLTFDL